MHLKIEGIGTIETKEENRKEAKSKLELNVNFEVVSIFDNRNLLFRPHSGIFKWDVEGLGHQQRVKMAALKLFMIGYFYELSTKYTSSNSTTTFSTTVVESRMVLS